MTDAPRSIATKKTAARLEVLCTAILSNSFISRSFPALAAPPRHADAVSISNTSARVQELNQVPLYAHINIVVLASIVCEALAGVATMLQRQYSHKPLAFSENNRFTALISF